MDVWNKLKVETEIEDLELKKTYISKRESNKIKNFTSIPLHFPVRKIQDTHSTWFLVAKMEKAKEVPIVVPPTRTVSNVLMDKRIQIMILINCLTSFHSSSFMWTTVTIYNEVINATLKWIITLRELSLLNDEESGTG